MSDRSDLTVRKPVSIWKRPIELKFGLLVQSLGKGAISAAFLNLEEVGHSGVEFLESLGLQGNKPEEIAWLLLYKSLLKAMSELVREVQRDPEKLNVEQLCEQLDEALEQTEFSLGSDFFQRPKNLPILETLKTPYQDWLQACSVSPEEAAATVERLPSYFLFALVDEYRLGRLDYAKLGEWLQTPFDRAKERELAWERYRAWLQRQVDNPMFAEAFGLRQVYIPLRAYYERKRESEISAGERRAERLSQSSSQKVERVVVDLHTSLSEWIERTDKEDTIRVICGGPGCGKSSFGKMFAAQLAEKKPQLGVLFVPLHQIDPSLNLRKVIEEFVRGDRQGILPPNPLERENTERQQQILLIFDGLDELAMQGKVAIQVARDFVQEVQTRQEGYNRDRAEVFVLISGRDVVVEANRSKFRREEQVLHILPYVLSSSELTKYQFVDEGDLLKEDRRQVWWRTYGTLRSQNYSGLPLELDRRQLTEITAQPLLNYLVALSYDRNELDFSYASNLNTIYADLLDRVYERDWENYQHPALGDIEKASFVRILEEIAVACWQGNGRTATLTQIERRCTSGNLKKILGIFQEGAQEGVTEGVTRLLTAFYFRGSGTHEGDKTFEFIHKSFGEYLTGRRIVRQMTLMHKELTRYRDEPDTGWNEKECLKRWAELCGPSALDEYLLSFLQDEMKLQNPEQVTQWQQTLCSLIGFMLRQGMPMEALQPRSSHLEETRQARNAEEALLAALSCCAWVAETLSAIDWPDSAAFGTWLARLQGQRTKADNCVALMCLNYFKLDGCVIEGANLKEANLEEASLEGANLSGVRLKEARLDGASLDGASLNGASLNGASLNGASLDGASLDGASLDGASLDGASLDGANLDGANLDGANLDWANLNKASLDWASLDGANLNRANLDGASLYGASLYGANLNRTSLDDISWNSKTNWGQVQGLETAKNVPEQLKQELGL